MKYTYEETWEAVFAFLPSMKLARASGADVNLVAAIRRAAEEIFVIQNSFEQGYNDIKDSQHILPILKAVLDLRQKGFFDFKAE